MPAASLCCERCRRTLAGSPLWFITDDGRFARVWWFMAENETLVTVCDGCLTDEDQPLSLDPEEEVATFIAARTAREGQQGLLRDAEAVAGMHRSLHEGHCRVLAAIKELIANRPPRNAIDDEKADRLARQYNALCDHSDSYERALAALYEYQLRSGLEEDMAAAAREAGIERPENPGLGFGLDSPEPN
jgi:hypothetical protein